MERSSHNSFGTGQDWLEFLQKHAGLGRIPLGVVEIGQNLFRAGGIGLNSFNNGRDRGQNSFE